MSMDAQDKKDKPTAACRDSLFEPGRYLSCPLTIMAMVDLSASAKCVWMALAAHLGRDGSSAWPSVARLCRRTGQSRSTVLRCIEQLESLGLVAIERSFGASNIYRLRQPEAGLFDDGDDQRRRQKTGAKLGLVFVNQSQNDTSAKMGLVPANPAEIVGGSAKMGPVSSWHGGSVILNDNQCQNDTLSTNTELSTNTPQPPLQGGVCAGGPASLSETKAAVSVRLLALCNETGYGCDDPTRHTDYLPSSWPNRIDRECKLGQGPLLLSATAADMRAGMQMAVAKKTGFGIGWLLQAVRRLLPSECEKLQGFEPGYTAITFRGKPAADGPRYRALGNSMAVPCMFWIGQRIQQVMEYPNEQS